MAIIGSIRKHSWIAVAIVGIAILAFILGDLTKNNGGIPDVGKVDGVTMTSQRFNELVTEMENNYKTQQQTAQVPSEIESQIREQVWQQFVDETLMEEQTSKLGMRVSAAEVSESLNFLVKAGLLEKDEQGRFVQTEKSVTTGPMAATPVAVRGMHRQMGEFALDAIEGVPQDERHFSGITLGITHEAYEEIVQEIAECRKRVIAIATKSPAMDEVYRLNMQLFPLTQKNGLKKG